MKENINALDEVSKGASMGMDAIHFIIDKVEDQTFHHVLEVEYNKYQKISEKVKKIYEKYNQDDEPHQTSMMTKAMTWYGIEMKTFLDQSNSKIAELLIQGTNMGITEGRRILNRKEVAEDVEKIVSEFVTMQEDSVATLQKYL